MKNNLLTSVFLVGGFNVVYASSDKPNIIFILADDMGYGDMSCLNPTSKTTTSNLDGMAADGVVFTDAHSSSSVSTPTRYGMLTAW